MRFLTTIVTLVLALTAFNFMALKKGAGFSPKVLGAVDNLVVGREILEDSFKNAKDETTIILPVNNENKKEKLDYAALAKQAQNIYLAPTATDGQFSFVGTDILSQAKDWQLRQVITEDTELEISYNSQSRRLDFVLPADEYQLGAEKIKGARTVIASALEVDKNDMVAIGEDRLINLNYYANDQQLTVKELRASKITAYKLRDPFGIDETMGSFEDGLWRGQAYDCSNWMEGEPQFSMELSQEAAYGRQALLLGSGNHYACTNREFSLDFKPERRYKLSFEYNNLAGGKAGYYWGLRNGSEEKVTDSEMITAPGAGWHHFETIIKNWKLAEPEAVALFFYAPSNGREEIVNLYDNVKVEEYEPAGELTVREWIQPGERALVAREIDNVGSDDLVFGYTANGKNLLQENSSFEERLWTGSAHNCTNGMQDERMVMELVDKASDGHQALKISSSFYQACTNKQFEVDFAADREYALSFDYLNLAGGKIKYYYRLENEKGDKFFDQAELAVATGGDWKKLQVPVQADQLENPTRITLFLYAPANGDGEVVDLYDNVRLEETGLRGQDNYLMLAVNSAAKKRPEIKALGIQEINKFKEKLVLKGVRDNVLVMQTGTINSIWRLLPAKERFAFGQEKGIQAVTLNQGSARHNGWLVNVGSLCRSGGSCVKNGDGSYNVTLLAEHNLSRAVRWGYWLLGAALLGYWLVVLATKMGVEWLFVKKMRLAIPRAIREASYRIRVRFRTNWIIFKNRARFLVKTKMKFQTRKEFFSWQSKAKQALNWLWE